MNGTSDGQRPGQGQLSDYLLLRAAAKKVVSKMRADRFMPPTIALLGEGAEHWGPFIKREMGNNPDVIYLRKDFASYSNERVPVVRAPAIYLAHLPRETLLISAVVNSGDTLGEGVMCLTDELNITEVRTATLFQNLGPSFSANYVYKHTALTKAVLKLLFWYRYKAPSWVSKEVAEAWLELEGLDANLLE